jgi:hypothetical protein
VSGALRRRGWTLTSCEARGLPLSRSSPYLRVLGGSARRGASLQEVKDLLGYAHLSPEHLRSAVTRLDTALPSISSAQASAQEVVSEGVLLRRSCC